MNIGQQLRNASFTPASHALRHFSNLQHPDSRSLPALIGSNNLPYLQSSSSSSRRAIRGSTGSAPMEPILESVSRTPMTTLQAYVNTSVTTPTRSPVTSSACLPTLHPVPQSESNQPPKRAPSNSHESQNPILPEMNSRKRRLGIGTTVGGYQNKKFKSPL